MVAGSGLDTVWIGAEASVSVPGSSSGPLEKDEKLLNDIIGLDPEARNSSAIASDVDAVLAKLLTLSPVLSPETAAPLPPPPPPPLQPVSKSANAIQEIIFHICDLSLPVSYEI